MISTDMYNILACIPKTPGDTNINEVREKSKINAWTLKTLLELALTKNYIEINSHIATSKIANPMTSFFITDEGVVAREEYESSQLEKSIAKQSLKISQKAFKIAVIGVIISALAIIVSVILA